MCSSGWRGRPLTRLRAAPGATLSRKRERGRVTASLSPLPLAGEGAERSEAGGGGSPGRLFRLAAPGGAAAAAAGGDGGVLFSAGGRGDPAIAARRRRVRAG